MKEALDNAIQELKRVDHLFYVSLKYTRTVDVIRSIVDRLINAFDFGMESMLKQAKEKKLIESIPKNAGLKTELLKKTYKDNEDIINYLNFYLKLRKIMNADYIKREEYRRHVTMISTLEKGEIVEIDIDRIKEYYNMSREFIELVRKRVYDEENA